MTVKELIDLLSTFPPDTLVIQTCRSDYAELDPGDITLVDGRRAYEEKGCGLIRHKGHLMDLYRQWLPQDRPAEPEFVTAVHFAGN